MSNPAGYNVANVQKQNGDWVINGTVNVDTTAGGALQIDGSDVSAGLQEIANLAGISAAELGFIDGVTAGTAAASKAVVLDSSGNTSGIVNLTTTGNTVLGNAAGDTFKVHGTAGSGAQSAFTVAPPAITGGESPTEAEHNAALTEIAALKACLINHGLMAAS